MSTKVKTFASSAPLAPVITRESPSTPPTSHAAPCRFFQAGHCSKGASCPFSHRKTTTPPPSTGQVCRFYLNGACRNGERVPEPGSPPKVVQKPPAPNTNPSAWPSLSSSSPIATKRRSTVDTDAGDPAVSDGAQMEPTFSPSPAPIVSSSPRASFFESLRRKDLKAYEPEELVIGPISTVPTSAFLPSSILADVEGGEGEMDDTDVVESLFGGPKTQGVEVLQKSFIEGLLDDDLAAPSKPTTTKTLSSFVPSATAPILIPRMSNNGPTPPKPAGPAQGSLQNNHIFAASPRSPPKYRLIAQEKAEVAEPQVQKEPEDSAVAVPSSAGTALTCGLCSLSVFNIGRKYGILSDCNDVFCLVCIKDYRTENNSDECPLCNVASHAVVPSTYFTTEKSKKDELFGLHKDKMKKTPCKHFNFGKGVCKYGSSCHYAHVDENGQLLPSSPSTTGRTIIGSDGGVKHYSELTLTLGSFLDIAERTKR